MDFSDLGGVPVGALAPQGGGQEFPRENFSPKTAQIDFSDLGGKPVPPDEGAMAAAGRGALRNFPLAQQAAAAIAPVNPFAEKGTYSEEMTHLTNAAEASKAAHPVAYGTGAVAGALAPLAIPGVGEALEAAPILGNAAFGAAQSVSDANLTKPTGRDLAGAAIGAGLGGTLGAVGKGLRAAAPDAEELAASSAAKGFGTTARNVGKIMGEDPNATLKDLGLWANKVSTNEGDPLVSLVNRPGKMLKALTSIHDSAGEEIGDILETVNPGASLPKASLTKDLYPLADELETLAPKAHGEVMGVINKINKLADAGRLDLKALNKIKSFVGSESAENPTMARVYGHLADATNGVIDEYGRVIGDPSTRAAYEVAKENYRNASRLLPILRRATGKELSQGPAGNGGLLGLFGMAGGLATGHPVAGALAMPVNAVARPIGEMLSRNMALQSVPRIPQMVEGAKALGTAAQLELTNALESKFKKKEQE